MQIVFIGEDLQEMSEPVFWKKLEKYFNMSPAANFTQLSAKHWFCILKYYFQTKFRHFYFNKNAIHNMLSVIKGENIVYT